MGQWIKVPVVEAPFSADLPEGRLFVNQKGLPSLGRESLRLIGEAGSSIDIINPLVTDQRIVQALTQARGRGVRVRVITELRDNRGDGITYPTRGFEASDTHVLRDHFEAIRVLAKRRVFLRGLTHYVHAKLLSIDKHAILISSANLTANSLGWGQIASLEAGVRVETPSDVAQWQGAVEALWECCPFRLRLLREDVSLQQEGAADVSQGTLNCETSSGCYMAWSFPPVLHGIRDQLVNLCDESTRRITLCAMSFYDIDHVPSLYAAVSRALRRGVKVTAIVRPEHFKPEQYPDASTLALIDQGLELLGHTGLHAKGVSVDSVTVAIDSHHYVLVGFDCDAVELAANDLWPRLHLLQHFTCKTPGISIRMFADDAAEVIPRPRI